ncbi:MAG: chaperone NapD [Sneathiella sp.]
MEEAIYISSLVAQVDAGKAEQLKKTIEAIPYAEVPLLEPSGKLVVLLDAPGTQELASTTEQIRELPGIFSLLPVYQHDERGQAEPFKISQTSDREERV